MVAAGPGEGRSRARHDSGARVGVQPMQRRDRGSLLAEFSAAATAGASAGGLPLVATFPLTVAGRCACCWPDPDLLALAPGVHLVVAERVRAVDDDRVLAGSSGLNIMKTTLQPHRGAGRLAAAISPFPAG
jgi:hypothetical protein